MTPAILTADRYARGRVLGRGGMATVYLAIDRELGRSVAIKLLWESFASDEVLRARFLKEARLAAGLAHPNIVQVLDVDSRSQPPYIVMEYVEGETLADLLRKRGKLLPGEASPIVRQVCAALDHAHTAGIVHRDVKPHNILVRVDGTVKVADFGIARAIAEVTRLTDIGTVLGTASYLAPEQARGEDVSPSADIYSLGAVVYELLTGTPPYVASTLPELLAKQQTSAPTPVLELAPSTPLAVAASIMRCLARNPAERPASATDLARAFEETNPELTKSPAASEAPTRLLDHAPQPVTAVLSRARSGLRRQVASSGRRRALIGAGVAAAALTAGGFAAAVMDDTSTSRQPGATTPEILIPGGDDPQQAAENLAAWLRESSRRDP